MWIFLFFILLFWASLGSLLLFLKSKPVGEKSYLRKVDKRIYHYAETVTVTLELVPPVIKTPSIENHDVILVLDHSGSMGSAPGSPLRESVRAMENFVKQLPALYQIGLIVFDHEAQRLCNITSEKKEVLSALKTIGLGGGTELHFALDQCVDMLMEGREGVKKTLILLSDGGSNRKAADDSAAQVREHASNPTIICVGFGPNVDEALMKSVASSDKDYIPVMKADSLEPLFERLVDVVSGQAATAVLVEEKMMAPHPFRLDKTGEIYPVGIHQEKTTQVAWFLSLLQQQHETVSLSYTLKPTCLGWRSVAPASATARWKMPDGHQQTITIADGPKVLILPNLLNGLTWIGWGLLNPLFCLTFGHLYKCIKPIAQVQAVEEELPPLPTRTVPEPLFVPDSHVYIPKVRPALVIGLGALGEWSLSRLKWQLQDRHIDLKGVVDLLAIQDSGVYNRPFVSINGCLLDNDERVILQQDLRYYLEYLRHQENVPDSHDWIPWRQWLGETRPLTTYTDDRRKARLALLLQPEDIEQRIKNSVARIREQEGIVLIVAGAGESEGAGMLAEVAHICASYEVGATAVIVPDTKNSPETTGMVRELERMLGMPGESIPSDRGGKRVSAKRLFDRVIVANPFQENAEKTSKTMSHLLWDLLAYPEVLEQMPTQNDTCYQVQLQGQTLPQRSLWHWVRGKTLRDLINQRWLGATIIANQVTPPATNPDAVRQYVTAFWDNSPYERRQGELLKKSALVLHKNNPFLILEEALDIPLDKPYHEQKAYCDQERDAFFAYLEAWCHYMLAAENEKVQWGLLTLLEAVTHIEADFEKLIEHLNKLSGNTALVEQLSFISSIYTDYQVALGGLRSSLEQWIAIFVGWQPGMKVNPLPHDFVPICLAIEKKSLQAKKELPFQQVEEVLTPLYQEWKEAYGENFLQQLCFQVKPERQTRGLVIQLHFFDHQLAASDNLTDAFHDALDRYKAVIFQWPAESWVGTEEVQNQANALRLGKFSRPAYPRVSQAINEADPFVTAALSIKSSQLTELFHLAQGDAAIYAWPEEANAARIADKIRHIRQREPELFSPKVVSFMRDTKRLYDFMADLAENRITIQNQNIMLNRADGDFKVGSTSPPRSSIAVFEDVVRQVVTLGVSLNGEPLPSFLSDWAVTPEEAVKLVKQNALAATDSTAWTMWQDVIMGLALEHGSL